MGSVKMVVQRRLAMQAISFDACGMVETARGGGSGSGRGIELWQLKQCMVVFVPGTRGSFFRVG